MLLSAHTARRVVAGAVGTGAIAGAMFIGAMPSAMAQPAPPPPPNCTAADLAGVASGVSAATSAYLFAHPDVNWFFTGLEGVPRDQVQADVEAFLNQHPQTKADLHGIRQPLVDIRNRCGDPAGDGIADS
jgi:heme-binding protein